MINARSISSQRAILRNSKSKILSSVPSAIISKPEEKDHQFNHTSRLSKDSPDFKEIRRSKSIYVSPPRSHISRDLSSQKLHKRNSQSNEHCHLYETSASLFSNLENSASNTLRLSPLKRNRHNSNSAEKLASLDSIVDKCENVRRSMSKSNLSNAMENAISWKVLRESLDTKKERPYVKSYQKSSEDEMIKEALELQKKFEIDFIRKKRKIWKNSKPALAFKLEKSLNKYRIK
ncbi:unnamed protein product [Blepharisma stoltei]|uniref:Uncharacterized protein n=1 Tax=Blepharisma stoltei TaxID=1481888 RepID=A0AAU9JXX3_9CILI|nr:unnamed protein product [Blepharisma stoltei]